MKFLVKSSVLACLLGAVLCPAIAQQAPSTPYVWRNVEIVGGGFVPGLIFHPKQRDLIYARTDIGGAYRWDSGAKRWIPLSDWASAEDWNLFGIESIAPDPTDANRVYMAAGTYTNSWAGNGAILRSNDQGRSWQRTNMPFKMGGNEDGRSIGERLTVDPHQNSRLFFGSRHDELWKSEDFGATWKKIESFPLSGRADNVGIGFVLFDERSGHLNAPTPTIYAAVEVPTTSLYRSADGGATWQEVPGQPKGFLPHHGVFDEKGTLFLTYGNAPGPNGMTDGAVWKLNTKNGKWKNITPLKPSEKDRFGYAGLALDAQHSGTLMVSTMDRWARRDEIFRSRNGGKSWTLLGPKSTRDSSVSPFLNWGKDKADLGHWIGDVEIDPFNSDHALYVTGATIWGTDNLTSKRGTFWTPRAAGLEETAVQKLVSPPQGAALVSVIGDLGGFRHDDLTVSPRAGMFSNPQFSSGTGLDFAERKPEFMARVGAAGGATKRGAYSTDGGQIWTPFAGEPADGKDRGSIAVSCDGAALVWTPEGGLPWYSLDRGALWVRCTGLQTKVNVASDRAEANTFHALDSNAGRLFVSHNGGVTFDVKSDNAPGGKLSAAPGRAGDLWIAGDKGLFHSTDGGATFNAMRAVQKAEAIGFGKAAPGHNYHALYLAGTIGGTHGLFRSDDGGASWLRLNDDAHQYGNIGQSVSGDPRLYGRVYFATNGRGILYGDPASSP